MRKVRMKLVMGKHKKIWDYVIENDITNKKQIEIIIDIMTIYDD